MSKTKSNKLLLIVSAIIYIISLAAMIAGTLNDVKIDIALFNPENSIAKFFENFGLAVYWGFWGPAFTIIFLCRRDLNESLAVIGKLIPKVKTVTNTDSKVYKFFNFVVKTITTVGFFVLSVVGWKKLIENVIKNILRNMNMDNWSQAAYFIICTVVAAIAIFLFRNIDKEKLRKLEALALAGVLFGVLIKIVEECKTITNRVRFREMVAYSNGFLNEEGLSEGKYSPLTSAMAQNTDFSAFTQWYKIGDDMGMYNRADSFPSGHTTEAVITFLTYPLFLAFDKLKKFAPIALIASFAFTAAMAITRLITGAHYLTDVAGAALITYSLFLIVYNIYSRFTKKSIIG
ncbi:MAG: phosphatase PAP2 family protein [Acetobacter sp.]|nr:phosphatase PAP2 family protein [Bacteroides sp.]MCM1341323.1 phosphatase PAP2 family protein [Acetobacter sp.]MCM1433901.1 phosphatase PAP2 family protein [Clostridiales bacterium]